MLQIRSVGVNLRGANDGANKKKLRTWRKYTPLTKKKEKRHFHDQIPWSIMGHFYCNLFPLYSTCQDGSNDGIHINHRQQWTSKTWSKHNVSARRGDISPPSSRSLNCVRDFYFLFLKMTSSENWGVGDADGSAVDLQMLLMEVTNKNIFLPV